MLIVFLKVCNSDFSEQLNKKKLIKKRCSLKKGNRDVLSGARESFKGEALYCLIDLKHKDSLLIN